MKQLWSDDSGFLVSTELLFLAVVLVLGLIAGWSALRGALLQEYGELASAIAGLNHSYFIAPVSHALGGSGGTQVTDSAPSGSVPFQTGAAPATTTIQPGQFIP